MADVEHLWCVFKINNQPSPVLRLQLSQLDDWWSGKRAARFLKTRRRQSLCFVFRLELEFHKSKQCTVRYRVQSMQLEKVQKSSEFEFHSILKKDMLYNILAIKEIICIFCTPHPKVVVHGGGSMKQDRHLVRGQ